MQLEEFLERSAQARPEKTFLVCGARRYSFGDVDVAANRLAHALAAEGIRRGDRVAVFLDNGFEAVVSVFAILKAGAVFIVVNPTTKADKLKYILNNSRAAALIAPARKLAGWGYLWQETMHLVRLVAVGGAAPELPAGSPPCVAFDDLIAACADRDAAPAKRAIDVDLAALIYTSGSDRKSVV